MSMGLVEVNEANNDFVHLFCNPHVAQLMNQKSAEQLYGVR